MRFFQVLAQFILTVLLPAIALAEQHSVAVDPAAVAASRSLEDARKVVISIGGKPIAFVVSEDSEGLILKYNFILAKAQAGRKKVLLQFDALQSETPEKLFDFTGNDGQPRIEVRITDLEFIPSEPAPTFDFSKPLGPVGVDVKAFGRVIARFKSAPGPEIAQLIMEYNRQALLLADANDFVAIHLDAAEPGSPHQLLQRTGAYCDRPLLMEPLKLRVEIR